MKLYSIPKQKMNKEKFYNRLYAEQHKEHVWKIYWRFATGEDRVELFSVTAYTESGAMDKALCRISDALELEKEEKENG